MVRFCAHRIQCLILAKACSIGLRSLFASSATPPRHLQKAPVELALRANEHRLHLGYFDDGWAGDDPGAARGVLVDFARLGSAQPSPGLPAHIQSADRHTAGTAAQEGSLMPGRSERSAPRRRSSATSAALSPCRSLSSRARGRAASTARKRGGVAEKPGLSAKQIPILIARTCAGL